MLLSRPSLERVSQNKDRFSVQTPHLTCRNNLLVWTLHRRSLSFDSALLAFPHLKGDFALIITRVLSLVHLCHCLAGQEKELKFCPDRSEKGFVQFLWHTSRSWRQQILGGREQCFCSAETELSITKGGQMEMMNTVATNRISFAQKTTKIS